MVKLDRFDIIFDNPEHVYFAGQEISGKIIIVNSDVKKASEILLEIKGRAKTYWTKHSGKSRRHYSSSEPYFCEQFNTLYTHRFEVPALTENGAVANAKAESNEATTSEKQKSGFAKKERNLPAGTHEIPFSYTLPKTLPSSFEGEYGFVRYTCRAICERPWDFDISSRRAFTVVGVEDINQDTELLKPHNDSATFRRKHFGCISHGEVNVELRIPRSGYTPGEAILVSARVENKTSRAIRSTCLKLCQHVCYKFSGAEQMKNTSRTLVTLTKDNVRPNSTVHWTDERLIVPSIPPRLSTCKIIQITYTVELEVLSTERISLPITIGTIPALVSQLLTNNKKRSNAVENVDVSTVNGGHTGESPQSTGQSPPPVMAEDSSIVQVTITDESGKTIVDGSITDEPIAEKSNQDEPPTAAQKKRVRMPSSILSELYPTLTSPYYKESFFGRVSISEEKEPTQFGDNFFAPKYPFYCDD